MPSTKGKPTDPELHDEVTEKIKQQPNKDGECQDIQATRFTLSSRSIAALHQAVAKAKWRHGRLPK